jgi:hypothetical protein
MLLCTMDQPHGLPNQYVMRLGILTCAHQMEPIVWGMTTSLFGLLWQGLKLFPRHCCLQVLFLMYFENTFDSIL